MSTNMEQAKMDSLFAGVEYDVQQLKFMEAGMKAAMQSMQSSLIDKFEAMVAKNPKKPFVIFEGLIYTFEAINILACQVANVVRKWNLQPYDCVAIMMLNEPAFIYTFLGLQKLGIPVALINTNLIGKTLVHSVGCVECKALIVGADEKLWASVKDVLPHLKSVEIYAQGVTQHALPAGTKSFDDLMKQADGLAAPAPSLRSGVKMTDTCCYLYTSGTTGMPKPVIISQMKVSSYGWLIPYMVGDQPNDILYLTIPLYHGVACLAAFGSAVGNGYTMLLRKKFSASEFWNDCRQHKVTIVPYTGEVMRFLLSQPKSELDGVHNVRAIVGNGLRADIWQELKERFKIPKIYEAYGASESFCTFLNLWEKPGCIGRLSPLLTRLDPNPKYLVKFNFETSLPIRDTKGHCILVKQGEPGLLLVKVPDHLKNTKIYKAGQEENEKKIVRDVFVHGDSYYNTGDAMFVDKEYFLYFYDRLGDTFRWKGENVSTKEVANMISALPFVEDANVYGVTVPGNEGKAGMAAINLTPKAQLGNKELSELYTQMCKELPAYARPLFVRHIPEAIITGTFKNQKTGLAGEGYDLNKVGDPLYFIDHENKTYSTLNKLSLTKFIKSRL